MNGPSASDRFTSMPKSLRDEILLTSFNWDPLSFNDEGIATLDD
jgi:hypothetical protein